ncbi:MAG: hypothetical protein NZ937_02780 [Armatimonadetes bacterium]|nr:hypothetical protein [Armatimonadota bacterium]
MSDREVLTIAWLSHQYFGANYQANLFFLKSTDRTFFPRILSESQFMGRIHCFLDFLPTLIEQNSLYLKVCWCFISMPLALTEGK